MNSVHIDRTTLICHLLKRLVIFIRPLITLRLINYLIILYNRFFKVT